MKSHTLQPLNTSRYWTCLYDSSRRQQSIMLWQQEHGDSQTQGEVIMVQGNQTILSCLQEVLPLLKDPSISSQNSHENKSQRWSNREDMELWRTVIEIWFSQRVSVVFYTAPNPVVLQVIAKKDSRPLLSSPFFSLHTINSALCLLAHVRSN